MTRLESSLLVVHDFLGEEEHRLAASGGHIGSLGVSDDGVQDDPLFDDAQREVFVVFHSSNHRVFETELCAHEAGARIAEQTFLNGTIHVHLPARCIFHKLSDPCRYQFTPNGGFDLKKREWSCHGIYNNTSY